MQTLMPEPFLAAQLLDSDRLLPPPPHLPMLTPQLPILSPPHPAWDDLGESECRLGGELLGNPTDQQRVHSHCLGRSERQFCPDEDGFLAALPQELVVMGSATQEALQLGTDVLQRLLNTESSLPDSECCQGARHT